MTVLKKLLSVLLVNKYIKKKLNDVFFYFRMFLGVKLFSIRKSTGYYSDIKNILEGLKEDGPYKLENFYSENQIDELNKCGDRILVGLNEDSFDDRNLEQISGEIKIKRIDDISKTIRTYSREWLYILVSVFFYGLPKSVMAIFHLVTHDGGLEHKGLPGKSRRRISEQVHIDDTAHFLKIIIFLDDVTPETGGETVLFVNSGKKIRYSRGAIELLEIAGKLDNAANLENVEDLKKADCEIENELKKLKIIKDSNVKHLYGNKGDVVFIDTSNLHRASALKKGKRAVLWLYVG